MESNKQLVERFLEELWNKKNLSVIEELIADDYVDHTTPPYVTSKELRGPEEIRQAFTMVQQAFSSVSITINSNDQIGEDDKVVTPMHWEYTVNDNGAAPQVVQVTGIGIDRISDGKIVESWNTLDVLYRGMEQPDLSALPQNSADPATVGSASAITLAFPVIVPSGPNGSNGQHPCVLSPGFHCSNGALVPNKPGNTTR